MVKGTNGPGCVVYQPLQPLFFGTSKDFARAFTPGADPQKCVVDLSRSAVADYTAVDALADVAARYEKVEKSFEIIGVSADDKKFIQLAGPAVKGAADALDGGVTRVSSKTALVDDIEANPKDVELRQRPAHEHRLSVVATSVFCVLVVAAGLRTAGSAVSRGHVGVFYTRGGHGVCTIGSLPRSPAS